MEVILLKDVDKVGLRGDVVNVARGYMRNYLAPRRLAEPATAARVAELGRREAERAKHEARSFEHAQEIAETLRKTVLRFEAPSGPRGVLFGSVTATDVADELWRTRKIRVDRRKIELRDPIKRVGRYEVPVDVFQDVRVEVKTLVVPEGGELPPEEELEAWAAEDAAAEAESSEAAPDEEEASAEVDVGESSAENFEDAEAAGDRVDEPAGQVSEGVPEGGGPTSGDGALDRADGQR